MVVGVMKYDERISDERTSGNEILQKRSFHGREFPQERLDDPGGPELPPLQGGILLEGGEEFPGCALETWRRARVRAL